MANLMDLFKDMYAQFLELGNEDKGSVWTSISKGSPALLVRRTPVERIGYMVYGKHVFTFLFSDGGNNFVHAAVRRSNKTIGISGPRSMEIFCSQPSLRGLSLVSAAGACIDDEVYWETFFKTHGVKE